MTTETAANMATLNEQGGFPGGIIGFRLVYSQGAC